MIKTFYGFNSLGKEQMKIILREGAKQNQILWIPDQGFEELVEALNLPYEESK